MSEIFNWLKVNWQLILVVGLDLIGFVFLLIKRKIKIVDSPLTLAIEKLPSFIRIAESLFTEGKDKKAFVMSAAFNAYQASGGKKNVTELFDELIESILSTPEKKEEKVNGSLQDKKEN